jgi:AcrR family transcriptional regulator
MQRGSYTSAYPNTLLYVTRSTPRTRLTRAQQQAQTRANLLDAAERVFVERGLLGASVDAITQEAGYSRGAFYSNFGSKEELFAELLQQRVYSRYRAMADRANAPSGERPSLREVGEELAAIQAEPEGHWLFRLWLELLAHAGRDERFRKIAAGFWAANRTASAAAIASSYAEAGSDPPAAPEHLASAMIAMDIGLAIQHFVDPNAAPLELYPELYELVFGALAAGRNGPD